MAEVFSLRLPTAQGVGLKKFFSVSGLFRVTYIIWPVLGYYGKKIFVSFFFDYVSMVKDKKKMN